MVSRTAFIFSPHVSPWSLWVEQALRDHGWRCSILIRNKVENDADDSYARRMAQKDPGVNFVSLDTFDGSGEELLVVCLSQFLPATDAEYKKLRILMRSSKQVVLLERRSDNRFLHQMKYEVLELCKLPRLASKVKVVLHEDRVLRFSPWGCFMKQGYLGVAPHPLYMCNDAMRNTLYDLSKMSPTRTFLYNFMGSVHGESRTCIIEELRNAYGIFQENGAYKNSSDRSVYTWISDVDKNGEKLDYLDVLQDSYFTLCLPGITGTTHRTVEAMIKCSIPVLPSEAIPYYQLPLVDGVNCIAVDSGDWRESMNRIENLKENEIRDMQFGIQELAKEYLSREALNLSLLKRLQLVDE